MRREGCFSFAWLLCTKLFHYSYARKVFIYFLASLVLCLLFWDQAAGSVLQNELKKYGSNIDFWKECQAQFSICLENSFSNKLPEMGKTYKGNITTLLPCYFLLLATAETEFWLSWNFGLIQDVHPCILYDSSGLTIIWHFKPRNIPNNFRDICSTLLLLCFLITLVESGSQMFQNLRYCIWEYGI